MRRTASSVMLTVIVAAYSRRTWAGVAQPDDGLQGTAGGVAASLGLLGLVSLLAVVACLSLALALLLRERHHRRRLGELLGRLAELEEIWQDAAEPEQLGKVSRPDLEGHPRVEGSPRWPRGPLSSLISSLRGGAAEPLPGPERLDYNAVRVLYARLDQRTTPAELAAELNMSLRTLQRGLAEELDCTPSELIVAVTMREAKRRLVVDGLQVQEVARSLGFDNPFYFSRRFKAYYRMTPSELRREAQDKAS